MALNIVCCVKQVLDPELPPSAFRIDEVTLSPVLSSQTPLVISQFDAIAVEAALRLREEAGEARVTILSLGPDSSREAIKYCLAMGADDAVLLQDAALQEGDSYSTAVALSAAIRKIGNTDLVLCGRQSVDWDMGATGLAIAELLHVPSLTLARSVSVSDGKVRVERVLDDCLETAEVGLPAVVTVSNELGEPRYPKLPQIIAASRKPVVTWTAADLGLNPDETGKNGARLVLERLFIPQIESHCELIYGGSPEETAAMLLARLRDERLV